MVDPADHNRIPEAVPPHPLPEFDYEDVEKGERIGTGGDADVYRASLEHDGYTYPVAIKEPRFEGTIQKRVLEKFQTEAETWSSLNDHDNIVSVYGWGADPLPWLALEFMDGGTLEAKIGSLDVAEALWLSGRIAEGVRYGHRHGIAHLDIKPTNVLLRETPKGKWEYPKVSDWGLAKMLLEHSNSIEGISPTYAAPEQFDAGEYGSPDDFTDIYQLGALVYALVAGEPPFTGSSTAVMQSVLQEEPSPPSAVNSSVPSAVDEIVLRALAKNKDDRYDTVVEFRKELDGLFDEYTAGEIDSTTPTASSSGDETTEQSHKDTTDTQDDTIETDRSKTTDTGQQTQSSSKSSSDGSVSSPSSARDRTDDTDSSIVPRRAAVGLLGVGVLGGSGWMATQMGASNGGSTTEQAQPDPPDSPEESTSTDSPEESTGIVAKDQLVSRWPFQGNFDDTVGDNSASADSGSPTITTVDERQCVKFDGDDGLMINEGDNKELSVVENGDSGFSIGCWVHLEKTTNDKGGGSYTEMPRNYG